jgi:hypothetical protein
LVSEPSYLENISLDWPLLVFIRGIVLPHPHAIKIILIHMLTALQHIQYLSSINPLLSENNNAYFQAFLQDLSPNASPDYSLWKAAKRGKETINSSLPLQTARGTWARTNTGKAQTFTEHLESVFQPHPSRNYQEEEHLILELESPHQLEPPPRHFRRSEVQAIINNFKAKRSPGYDLITGEILQELPPTAVKYLTQLFNVAMLIGYFPMQ